MNYETYRLPTQQVRTIEMRMKDESQIEMLVKGFIYDEEQNINANIQVLADKVVHFLQLQGLVQDSFRRFFIDKNIPIEVTLNTLKTQQLVFILQQWLSFHSQNTLTFERLYSNNHRNILFKRVLLQQKQTIDYYFNTLSNKAMLKADDIYQLLVQILAPYHLYQCNTDGQTFFEKVNSFNTIKHIVEKFIHSEKRIVIGSTKQNFQFLRRFQFERLIQFWQFENTQLVLLSERRKNLQEISTQTTINSSEEKTIQTDRADLSLIEVINKVLLQLNQLTASSNNKIQLTAIQRIYCCLRKEKLNLIEPSNNYNQEVLSQKTQKLSPKSSILSNKQKYGLSNKNNYLFHLSDPYDVNDTVVEPTPKYSEYSKSNNKRIMTETRPISPNKRLQKVLQNIYNFYALRQNFDIVLLQKCLIDLGVIEHYNKSKINYFIPKGTIINPHHITFQQFRMIFKRIMEEDPDLNEMVLQQFNKSIKTEQIKKDYRSSLIISENRGSNIMRNYVGKYLPRANRF